MAAQAGRYSNLIPFCRNYEVQWKRPPINFVELERLRFQEKWTILKLTKHFKCGQVAIYRALMKIKIEK